MLYRVLKPLAGIAKRGELIQLKHLPPAHIAKLESVGAISRVAAPPLSEISDFADRAESLASHGIHDIEALVEAAASADAATLAAALAVPVETLCRWADEAQLCLFI